MQNHAHWRNLEQKKIDFLQKIKKKMLILPRDYYIELI